IIELFRPSQITAGGTHATDDSPSPSATASDSPAAGESPSGPASDERAKAPTASSVTVLRRGDSGAQVRELQLRLAQTKLYSGPADGVFGEQVEAALREYQRNRDITGDQPGVYGAATRERLEKETKEP
ncbi:peptidoglycan-binding domain-containing protein, partial [Streptomyces sp. S6]